MYPQSVEMCGKSAGWSLRRLDGRNPDFVVISGNKPGRRLYKIAARASFCQLKGTRRKGKMSARKWGLTAIGLLLAGVSGAVSQEAVELYLGDDLQQVRVEARDPNSGRWLAVASGYRDHRENGWLKVALPDAYAGKDLRVLGSPRPSPFAGRIESARAPARDTMAYPPSGGPGIDYLTDAGRGGGDPEIEEADIWAWQGSTLFFYNQYRGLQVIDLSDASQPRWEDYFRYPARGEDLYAMEDGQLVLIGTGAAWSGQQVALQFLEFVNGQVQWKEAVELEAGEYMDSRRYGDTLYVMTREWETEVNPLGEESQRPLIRLYTVALGDREGDRVRDVKTFAGNGWLDAVMTAQPDGILISVNKWQDRPGDWRFRWHSEVHVLVPGEDGIPRQVGVAPLAGVLQDKFKLQFRDGILTTLSQQADWSTGRFSRATTLENFELGTAGFRRIGSLDLAPGETLFASRFHGDTLYIVTFLLIDPLFAIDNSNPARPVVAGELEVPGWSDYLEWVDDQLFAVGVEDNRLTVSIFDVADPAHMSLKDRLYLSEDSWSSSEAQYDDQAISIYPEKRLLMLPFTTWSWDSTEPVQAMQLISWDEAGLQKRGSIGHLDTPRRGILLGDTVVTVSGRELVSTDISNPDLPVLAGQETLAWNVSYLMSLEDHFVQLDSPASQYGSFFWRVPYAPQAAAEPRLFVTTHEEPNLPAAEVPLKPGLLLGASLHNGRLLLLQDISASGEYQNGWNPREEQAVAARLYDLDDPLEPVLLAEAEVTDLPYLGNRFTPHVLGNAIIWSSSASLDYGIFLDVWPGPAFWNGNPGYLVTALEAGGTRLRISAWDRFDAEGNLGHASAWFWQPPVLMASQTHYLERQQPDVPFFEYEAVTRLLAVDFAEPETPLRLPPTEIPGSLEAVQALPDGLNHMLYFEPVHETLEVWGWDRANAFPLFKQALPGAGTSAWTHPLAWRPPLHVRQRAVYGDRSSTLYVEFWLHDEEANAFSSLQTFSFEDEWVQAQAWKDPLFLLNTSRHLHLFGAVPFTSDEGSLSGWQVDLLESLSIDLPFVYDMKLEQAVLWPEAIYLPVGLYGVEILARDPGGEAVRQQAAFQRLEAEASWTELPATRWSRVPRADSTHAGVLKRYHWLYRADSLKEVDPEATDAGDFWRDSAWFGWYAHQPQEPAWIHHLEHGLLYSYAGDTPGQQGIHFLDTGLGTVWTHADLYPWIYRYEPAGWLYYLQGSGLAGSRWFYRPGQGWQGEQP